MTGLALSTCTPDRWEEITVQFFLQRTATKRGALGMILQIQDGSFAPGAENQIPSEARIKENRVTDGQLDTLQRIIASFLLEQGFSSDGSDFERTSDVSCHR
jgi:hypothetical protein